MILRLYSSIPNLILVHIDQCKYNIHYCKFVKWSDTQISDRVYLGLYFTCIFMNTIIVWLTALV